MIISASRRTDIPAFQTLSRAIGREKVVWRYDPIFFSDQYTMDYHCKYFKVLAAKLGGYTEKCTVSFLDLYRNTLRNMQPLKIRTAAGEQQWEIMERFSEIAKEYGFFLDTCAEAADFSQLGIPHGCCIDRERLERIGECRLNLGKDRNQRAQCGCAASIDIGAYHTCRHGCSYCYANDSYQRAVRNALHHNPDSPLLLGELQPEDVVKERGGGSLKIGQMTFFDA